mmetsp:Transcript_16037/g.25909  ORF Transcript_16037/g.25909 Transcript_16037/m.25909 type:complete len:245 (+) Transcript_16037:667-1401(+)
MPCPAAQSPNTCRTRVSTPATSQAPRPQHVSQRVRGTIDTLRPPDCGAVAVDNMHVALGARGERGGRRLCAHRVPKLHQRPQLRVTFRLERERSRHGLGALPPAYLTLHQACHMSRGVDVSKRELVRQQHNVWPAAAPPQASHALHLYTLGDNLLEELQRVERPLPPTGLIAAHKYGVILAVIVVVVRVLVVVVFDVVLFERLKVNRAASCGRTPARAQLQTQPLTCRHRLPVSSWRAWAWQQR